MAQGDIKSDLQTITNNSYLTAQPSGSDEWSLRHIAFEGAAEIYWYNGTISLLLRSFNNAGSLDCDLLVRNGLYIRIKNVAGADKVIHYSGRQSK